MFKYIMLLGLERGTIIAFYSRVITLFFKRFLVELQNIDRFIVTTTTSFPMLKRQ